MISLNILPKEAKKEIALKITYLKLKKIYAAFIILASFYGIILLGAKMAMQNQHLKIVEKASQLNKNLGENYSGAITEINSKMNSISKIQAEFVPFSIILNQIASASNNGIKMQSIEVSKKNNTVSFSGMALTRDGLLKLKADLENLDRFEKIDFPISNLAQQNNIPFNLSAKIKSYDIKE